MKEPEYERGVEDLSINNGVEQYRPGELYTMVSKCVENYKEHYGETPTPEMVSDILDIPVPIVEEVMKTIETTTVHR